MPHAAATLLDGRYALDELIGTGGFCEVWRATDTVLGRPVAVKLLYPGPAHQPGARARFKAEAQHAGALSDQNIARVYDYAEPADGQAYLVMELVDGPSLADVLARGPLEVAQTMDVVAQVALGLRAAHRAGVIHRDIKPANILLAVDGRVKITDFGIAHAVGSLPLTASGTVMGTPGYIAPERVSGGHDGAPGDLYALGIVAYECLAGARPFSGSPLEVAIAHRDQPLPPLPAAVPAEVVTLVMMLAAKDPAWRPASAGEVAERAARLRDSLLATPPFAAPVPGRPVAAAVTSQREPRTPAGSRSRRGPGLARAAAFSAAVVTLAIAGLAWFTSGSPSASHPPAAQSAAAQSSGAGSSGAATASPASSPSAATVVTQQPDASPSGRQGSSASAQAASTAQTVTTQTVTTQAAQHGKHKGQGKGEGKGNGK
jgi:serine/threonine-protein kinase